MPIAAKKEPRFTPYPLWKKLFYGGSIILLLAYGIDLATHMPHTPSAMKRHCTSEWILDTAAPYHTTNQPCAFASYPQYFDDYAPTKNYDSPVTYKGVKSYGYGMVKLDLQYRNPKVQHKTFTTLDHLYSYAPLELYFAQYVLKQANIISVSQLMSTNDGIQVPNEAAVVFEDRKLGLRIGNETIVMAQDVKGHYVFKARVPGGGCECPDSQERGIFNVSETDYSTKELNHVINTDNIYT